MFRDFAFFSLFFIHVGKHLRGIYGLNDLIQLSSKNMRTEQLGHHLAGLRLVHM